MLRALPQAKLPTVLSTASGSGPARLRRGPRCAIVAASSIMATMPEPSFRSRYAAGLEAGLAAVREGARLLPAKPGVYRMHAEDGEALYIGKARVLRHRVASYAQTSRLGARLLRMVSETRSVEFVVTEHEAEALLLEANQIKRRKPRYNILLRDDKSYPYILLRTDHLWPQLLKHRGRRRRKGDYFGPFASVGAVNVTLNALQRAFPLRTCTDSEFARRERPCLQHQIGRCTAPCTDRIGEEEYAALVGDARRFLGGDGREVQAGLEEAMEGASAGLEFERAAVLRDRIRALNQVQTAQGTDLRHVGDADVFALSERGRAGLGADLLLPRRPELRQPDPLPRACAGRLRRRGPRGLRPPSSTIPRPRPPSCC